MIFIQRKIEITLGDNHEDEKDPRLVIISWGSTPAMVYVPSTGMFYDAGAWFRSYEDDRDYDYDFYYDDTYDDWKY